MKFIPKDSGRGKNKQSDYKQKEAQKHITEKKQIIMQGSSDFSTNTGYKYY